MPASDEENPMSRRKKIYQVLAALLALGMLLAAAAVPADVRAEGEGPDGPAPVKPPPITGLNTGVTRSEGEEGEIDPSGSLRETGIEVPLWSEPPPYVEVDPPVVESAPVPVRSLAVPRRYQDPGDVTCGAAALGMALEFASLGEGTSPPSTDVLVEDLRTRGLLYEGVGTGAEELAYLARNHGYRGSYAFQDWTLAQLAAQLAEGRPPVVALGANGEGRPGHFVTVTGVSADETWIRYNDPVWGEQTVSSAEFLRLWGQQGKRGIIALQAPLSAASDPMLPWMGLFGALSMMAVLVGRESARREVKEAFQALRRKLSDPRRKGLGGKREPLYEWKKVQDGTKTVEDRTRKIYDYGTRWVKKGWKWIKDTSRKVYEYGTRWVKKGWKWVKDTSKKIYDYGTRWVQKGWKTVKDTSRKIYEYGTRWVQRGWKTVKDTSRKIYKYGTRFVRKGWKKVTSWVKGIWGWVKKTKWKPKYVKERFVKGWRYATKRVPRMVKKRFVKGWHYATRRVPRMVKERFVKGWHYATKKVPNLVKERFVKGWHYATKKVPNMVKERFVKGWHYATKEVPRYVWKKVRVEGKDPDPPQPPEAEEDRHQEQLRELLLNEESADEGQAEKMDEPPPWDDELRRFKMPEQGSRLELEYWARRHGISIGKIDEVFNPYAVKLKNGTQFVTKKKAYNDAIDELYAPYGGREYLGSKVYDQCLQDHCNNPLNVEVSQGLEPEKRIKDPSVRLTVLFDLNAKKSFSDNPARMFISRLKKFNDIDPYAIWNYEANWLYILMKQYPRDLLRAKWDYLHMCIERGKDMQEFIEEDMPAPDFTEVYPPTLE
jgi:hypothetical protein